MMASVSVPVRVQIQTCPQCKTELVRVPMGGALGSPLVRCEKCGRVYRTILRSEWYNFSSKWKAWLAPLLFFCIPAALGMTMWDTDIRLGLMMAGLGLFMALINGIPWLKAISASKKRMRDPEYLKQLLQYNAISRENYDKFMSKISG